MGPITREEKYLAKLCGDDIDVPVPVARIDYYYAKLCGMDINLPKPLTRTEMYLAKLCGIDIDIPEPVTRLDIFIAKACGMEIELPKPVTRIEMYWSIYIGLNATKELTDKLPLTFMAKGTNLLDYRIYGNSVQEENKSVGTATTNILPFIRENANPVKEVTVDYDVVSKEYIINGTLGIGGNIILDKIPYINWQENETYTITAYQTGGDMILGGGTGITFAVSIFDSSYTRYLRGSTTANSLTDYSARGSAFLSSVYTLMFQCWRGGTEFHNLRLKVSITKVPSKYEPYGYKIPIVCTGKNLIPSVSSENGWVNGWLAEDNGTVYPPDALRQEKTSTFIKIQGYMNYTFSMYFNGETPDTLWYGALFYNKDKEPIGGRKSIHNVPTATITAPVEAEYIRVSLRTFGDLLSSIQLEIGNTVTSYEPYYPPITKDIYIGDGPLRKVGEYADYIDYENKRIVWNVQKLVLTGNEKMSSENWRPAEGYYAVLLSEDVALSLNKTVNPLCLHFKILSYEDIYNVNIPQSGISIVPGSRHSFALRVNNEVSADEETLRAYLNAQYEQGTPVTIYYALSEPIIETLDLPAIPTLDGTTVIDVETEVKPSAMYIKYKS